MLVCLLDLNILWDVFALVGRQVSYFAKFTVPSPGGLAVIPKPTGMSGRVPLLCALRVMVVLMVRLPDVGGRALWGFLGCSANLFAACFLSASSMPHSRFVLRKLPLAGRTPCGCGGVGGVSACDTVVVTFYLSGKSM